MTFPPARALRLLACVLSLSLASGCGDACLNLAQQICSCQLDDSAKANCNLRAKQTEGTFTVRPVDEQFCQKQLDLHACDCTALNTAEGRAACGIAVTPPP